jgi:adenylate cyclase
MNEESEREKLAELLWRTYMTTGKVIHEADPVWFESKSLRTIVRRLPSDPRCKVCQYPFEGIGGKLSRMLLDVRRSKLNPQLCNICERTAQRFQGGAEIELSMLFADVRGSTSLAEGTSPLEFSKLINRFYEVTTRALFSHNAMVEKLIGDEVTGFFVPGFSGEHHASDAVKAAERILKVTGHRDKAGPWIPVGVGVHTGAAFVGAVTTSDGVSEITILGDSVNTAARLASEAGPGEIVVSESALANAKLAVDNLEARHLKLKGRAEPVDVRVIEVRP